MDRGGLYIPPGYRLHGIYLTDSEQEYDYIILERDYHFDFCPSQDFHCTKSEEFYHVEFVLMLGDDTSDETRGSDLQKMNLEVQRTIANGTC